MRTFIVTDPCYIMPHEVWDKACEDVFGQNHENKYEEFNHRIENDLRKFAQTENAWATDTGFGDWDNYLYGSQVVQHEFCADAGMVCVCELTPTIKQKLDEKELHSSCYATIEVDDDSEVIAQFNRENRDWTMITVLEDGIAVAESEEWISEDEEEEY